CTRMFCAVLGSSWRSSAEKDSPSSMRPPRTATAPTASRRSRRGSRPLVSVSTTTQRTAASGVAERNHFTPASQAIVEPQPRLQPGRLPQRFLEDAALELVEVRDAQTVRTLVIAAERLVLEPQLLQVMEGRHGRRLAGEAQPRRGGSLGAAAGQREDAAGIDERTHAMDLEVELVELEIAQQPERRGGLQRGLRERALERVVGARLRQHRVAQPAR